MNKLTEKMQRFLPAGSMGISLLLHLLIFLGISSVILTQAIPPKIPFTAGDTSNTDSDIPPPPDIPDDVADTPADLADTPADIDPATQRVEIEQIVSNAPAINPMNSVVIPVAIGSGGTPTDAQPVTQPKTTNALKGLRTMTNPFGGDIKADGAAITGYLYDLKQTADGKPSTMSGHLAKGWDSAEEREANGLYTKTIVKFLDSNWNEKVFADYYRVERPLSTYQIFIPNMGAGAAPAAFKAEKYVKPCRWVILYKGEFTSPASGQYRFVGIGDDVLIVRIGNKTVFDGSLSLHASGLVREGIPNTAIAKYRLNTTRDYFTLTAGQTYPIQILLGERPGGLFYAFLLIEKKGSSDKKPLPVFQFAPVKLPAYTPGKDGPAVAPEGFICSE